nr:ATP-binding cassette domain-containing protein [Lachnospiraceae bacterium]
GKLAASQNTKYFWHVLHLPMRFFSQRMAADIDQRRMASATIADMLVNIVAPAAIQSVMLIFYLVVMLRYSVLLTLIGLICVSLNAFVAVWVSKKRINVTRVMLRDESKLYSTTISGIEMIETIKASGAEKGFFGKWAGYQASVNTQRAKFTTLDVQIGKLPEIITTLANDLILVIGVLLVMRGEFSSGMVLAFSSLIVQFFAPAQSIVQMGQQIQEMRSQMERIDDVLEYPEDSIYDGEANRDGDEEALTKLSGAVTIKGLTFGYSKLAEPLIEDFSLDLKPGKSVAFVGGSGCGKSTLSRLISGLYQPWDGEILYDGKTIDQIDRDVFTGSLAVVNQEITMFEDTIANNIRMWDKSIEDFEMILAARDAQIHDDIMEREKGYQYTLGEGGRDFSGGQRQRIEIARVLAQDPTIIIMDEATSALDAKTEYDVIKSIRDRGITSIVVAHRLSTIRDCDEIIVLDQGKVVQRGTHNELMAEGGLYSKLVTSE